jgi:hypothetical protein
MIAANICPLRTKVRKGVKGDLNTGPAMRDHLYHYFEYTKCARRFCCQQDSVLSEQNGFSLP